MANFYSSPEAPLTAEVTPPPIIPANVQITICPIAHAESKESANFTWKHHFGVSALFPSLTGCDFDQRVQSGH